MTDHKLKALANQFRAEADAYTHGVTMGPIVLRRYADIIDPPPAKQEWREKPITRITGILRNSFDGSWPNLSEEILDTVLDAFLPLTDEGWATFNSAYEGRLTIEQRAGRIQKFRDGVDAGLAAVVAARKEERKS